MKFSAAQIAQIIDGKVEGDGNSEVNKLSKIEEGESGTLSFLANPLYSSYIYKTKASIVIVQEDFVPEKPLLKSCTLIRVKDPYSSFGKLLELYDQVRHNKTGVEANAYVSASAQVDSSAYIGAGSYISDNVNIGKDCKIYPNSFIGDNARIGDNTILYPGVKIYSDCEVGSDCIFHSGVVIGGDGFGFSPNSENDYNKLPQIGNVIIEDHVEIGSNSTIDRATMGSTVIRKGVKIDNLVQVGHNVEIGENTVIVAQTGIAGSAKIGKNCMIGGQVGIVGHINIGKNVKIAAQSGVSTSVKDNEVIQGSPAFAIGEYKRSYVYFRKLSDMQAKIDQLEKFIKSNIVQENE